MPPMRPFSRVYLCQHRSHVSGVGYDARRYMYIHVLEKKLVIGRAERGSSYVHVCV